jgi:hypothetical protein
LNQANVRFQFVFWVFVTAAIMLTGFLINWKYVWIIGVGAGILFNPIGKAIQNRKYASLTNSGESTQAGTGT